MHFSKSLERKKQTIAMRLVSIESYCFLYRTSLKTYTKSKNLINPNLCGLFSGSF